jgi:hypothetical protein
MQKNIQCLLLKTNQVIVSEVVEVLGELGEPDCKLIKPYLLNQSSFELTNWLEFTDQSEIMLRSEDVLTFTDPNKKVLTNYLDKIDL